ncbi:hypothetical protein LY78DRAFT_228239 [Colletotrichum sublineola]|nr:hypothetical protein LY78DRAFT_228239 [Colletotrichum sublineola]
MDRAVHLVLPTSGAPLTRAAPLRGGKKQRLGHPSILFCQRGEKGGRGVLALRHETTLAVILRYCDIILATLGKEVRPSTGGSLAFPSTSSGTQRCRRRRCSRGTMAGGMLEASLGGRDGLAFPNISPLRDWNEGLSGVCFSLPFSRQRRPCLGCPPRNDESDPRPLCRSGSRRRRTAS